MTCKEFFEEYKVEQEQKYAFGTYYPRENLIKNYLLPNYGEKELNEITSSMIDDIYDEIEEGNLSHNTLFGAYAALSSFFHVAGKKGYLNINSVENARAIRPEKIRMDD